jgi:hypothetical protein
MFSSELKDLCIGCLTPALDQRLWSSTTSYYGITAVLLELYILQQQVFEFRLGVQHCSEVQ